MHATHLRSIFKIGGPLDLSGIEGDKFDGISD